MIVVGTIAFTYNLLNVSLPKETINDGRFLKVFDSFDTVAARVNVKI